jgi:hypothetical protein
MHTQTEANVTIDGAHRVAALISGAIIFSLVVMGVVAAFIRGNGPGAGESLGIIRTAFYITAFSMIVLARMVSRAMKSRNRGESPQLMLIKMVRASVVTAAICEVPGILGVVLAVLGGERIDTIILLMMSIGMCWVFFPRLERWRNLVNAPVVS